MDVARTVGDGPDGATFTIPASKLSNQLLHVITPDTQISVTDEKRATWSGPATVGEDGIVTVKAVREKRRVAQ